jgi:hypothetical protein
MVARRFATSSASASAVSATIGVHRPPPDRGKDPFENAGVKKTSQRSGALAGWP